MFNLQFFYFKRKNKVLPKPVILTLSEFMVPGAKKEITKILSSFPSQLKELNEKLFVLSSEIILHKLLDFFIIFINMFTINII